MNKTIIETANIFVVPTGNRKAILLELITDQRLRKQPARTSSG
jgi:hypothetical protein